MMFRITERLKHFKSINSLLFFITFLILFLPTYQYSFQYNWSREDQSHGLIVLFIVIYLLWNKLPSLALQPIITGFEKLLGWSILLLGLLVFVIGRSQNILLLDLGSQLPVLLGAVILLAGCSGVKKLWFPIFFMLFMLPIPQAFLTQVTLPMKIAVSTVAEWVIYHTSSIPIAREGVMLFVDQYRLFVADACAGVHTLISLEALGLLYLDLVKSSSVLRNVILAALVVPISFVANVVRVIILILITYFYGNAVAQGFIHEYAGMVLFLVALSLILFTDKLLLSAFGNRSSQGVRNA